MKIIIFVLALFLSACVDVKIASQVPQMAYLILQDSINKPSKSCKAQNIKAHTKVGLLDISANTPFDSTNLYLFKNAQMSIIEDKKWIAQPADMLKSLMLSRLQSQCIQVALPPFGAQKLDKMLKISLLSLQIVSEFHKGEFDRTAGSEHISDASNAYSAHISIFYEIIDTKTYNVLKSGTISIKKPIQSLQNEYITQGFMQAVQVAFDEIAGGI